MSFILLGILNSQAAAGAAGVAGYVAGGLEPSRVSTVDKFSFSDDSRTTLATGLSDGRHEAAGFSNPAVAGYVAGGYTDTSAPSEVDSIEKFAFPADTRTTLGTGLSASTQAATGFENNAVAGYVAGGTSRTAVDKFAYPSDSRTTLSATLSSGRNDAGGFSNPAVAGYVAGGRDSGDSAVVDKFAFPADTQSTLATGLSTGRRDLVGFSHNAVAGYAAGGATSIPSSKYSTVDKFAFPSDSRTTLATGLSGARSDSAAFDNSTVAGYVAGGLEASLVATVDKFAFPSDTRSTLATGLSAAREESSAFQNG